MLVDDARLVLVEGHQDAHRGTEQGNIAVLDVPDKTTLHQQFPAGLESTREAVQSQFHLTTGRFDQHCCSCNKSVQDVAVLSQGWDTVKLVTERTTKKKKTKYQENHEGDRQAIESPHTLPTFDHLRQKHRTDKKKLT